MTKEKINLTSAEIGALWTSYMNESMSKRVLSFMLKDIQDNKIKSIIRFAYDMSCKQTEKLMNIFEKEQFAIPDGFTEEDININAPWLFSDTFCLMYINHMTKVGMLTYSGLLSISEREDIRTFFTNNLTETSKLYNSSTDTNLQKGTNARHPYIEVPKETDYIDNNNYLSGLNPFSDKRMLNAVEISYLYTNILTNSIGTKLSLAFAQTSPLKEVQDFMLRQRSISHKHIKIFSNALLKEDIQTPQVPDVSISDSTTPAFSDKLMMYHMTIIIAAGIGNYATAGAASQRSDLMLNYERLSLEVSRLAKSGADIMIKHSWLEQPPSSPNRGKLAKKK